MPRQSGRMAYPNRFYRPGGTYFFSVRLADPRSDLLVRRIDLFRDAVRATRQRWPFRIEAASVLPAEALMIWTLPPGDDDFPKRWRAIKTTFSRHMPAAAHLSASQRRKREKGIWHRRYWEHLITEEGDLRRHIQMVETAPATMGLVAHAADWPFGSAFRNGVSADFGPARKVRNIGDAAKAIQRSLDIPLITTGGGLSPPHPVKPQDVEAALGMRPFYH